MADAAETASHEMFQAWLDRGSDLIMAGEFDTWAESVELPLIIATAASRTVVADEAALRSGFDVWRATVSGNGATAMVRIAREVSQPSPDTLAGSFEVHLLTRGTRTAPPFNSWALLRRSREVWRLTHLVSGLANRRYPFSVLRIDPDSAQAPRGPARGPQGGTPGRRLH